MSVEFRQRTPSEYAKILWRRKWLIILPTIAIALAVAWAVRRLPDVYESTTLLTVRPAIISPSVVPQLSESDLTMRINNIGQAVVSRSSLQPLIEKHDLYAAERRRGEPMEALVERMRSEHIQVRLNTSRNDVINGFNISYRAPDPRKARDVTADLASKYVNTQLEAASRESGQTIDFFEDKLRVAKEELDAIEKRRLDFMLQNATTMPATASSALGQLDGLRGRETTLITELGRLRDQRAMLERQKGDVENQRRKEIENVIDTIGDVKSSSGYAALASRKAELEAGKQNLLLTYKPKHPDVIAFQTQIDSVQRRMDEMVVENKAKVAERRKQIEGMPDSRSKSIEYQLELINGEMQRQQAELAQSESQISGIAGRLDGVPVTDVGLQMIDREFQTKKATHDELFAQLQKAKLRGDVATTAQGESLVVLDSANLPSRPVAPNRLLLMALGLAAGLGFGFALAALFEVPRLLTIQTKEDAEHYTNLPVLVSLPEMLTPREERRLKMRRMTFAVAGVVAAIVSVPVLAIILRYTR
ncbi:MAG: Wzz/FepE/Etk N-terminal domain-containing protein, partial [Acidobacteriota bacterium]|nr:Wzz/FepE/Etk N-terminal domain-containing protein [Acidobacteriota bacterium]